MKKLLLILLCLPMIGFGQNVNIPDANFKAYLVGNILINTNGDAEIQVSEATSFNEDIDCQSMSIFDLTGIEEFTALTSLRCGYNQLTSLDVSNNLALTYLHCSGNQLTSLNVSGAIALTNLICYGGQLINLDVTQNSNLTELRCFENLITSLDVSNCTVLTSLNCHHNQLTTLDVSNNPSLNWLYCDTNQITNLDVRNGNNSNFLQFYSSGNPNLTCINVDDAIWSTSNWTATNGNTVTSGNVDPQQYFSNNCSGTSIQEQTTNKLLLKVTDLLGRETKQTNQPLFYIYDDGTVEKRIVIE